MRKWNKRWQTYARKAATTPFGRGDGDCCGLAAGWASLVSGQTLHLPSLTDDAAKTYLAELGGLEEATADALRPLGYRIADRTADYSLGIVTFDVHDNPQFPQGIGIIVEDRIATRSDNREGIVYIHPFHVEIRTVWNHPKLTKTWV